MCSVMCRVTAIRCISPALNGTPRTAACWARSCGRAGGPAGCIWTGRGVWWPRTRGGRPAGRCRCRRGCALMRCRGTIRRRWFGFGSAVTVQVSRTGELVVAQHDSGQSNPVSTDRVLRVGRWSHVVVTVDLDECAVRVWVDGARQRTHGASHRPAGPQGGTLSPAGDVVIGAGLVGTVDEVCVHSAALDAATIPRLFVVGLPKVYTQTQESRGADRGVPAGFKGSEPVPHPIETGSVFNARFALTAASEQGLRPAEGCSPQYLPGQFGGALRAVRTSDSVTYASPITGDSGTFEAWHQVITDPDDHRRSRRKALFEATGRSGRLVLLTEGGRWRVEFGTAEHPNRTVLTGPKQMFAVDVLEHVAVAWGAQPDRTRAVVLFVGGVEVARAAVPADVSTSYDSRIVIGGGHHPASLLVEDVRISNVALGWGQLCPSGQVATDAAGLDLRDSFNRPAGLLPLWWRPGDRDDTSWRHATRGWETGSYRTTGNDPATAQSLACTSSRGLHQIYHPDAYGEVCSIEAAVSFDRVHNGWAGVFVQASAPGAAGFDGHTFAINPATGKFRLAKYNDGKVQTSKELDHDFDTPAHKTFELTLTMPDRTDTTKHDYDAIRGYIDGINVISMHTGAGSNTLGHSGLFTDDTSAYFDTVHFSALTPESENSRTIAARVFACGTAAGYTDLQLTAFQWHKRRGLPAFQYNATTGTAPEPPGNIAAADPALGLPQPPTPIPPAFWRSQDSANSDLIVVDSRVVYLMRGNSTVPAPDKPYGTSYGARIGLLDCDVAAFDGIHYTDHGQHATTLEDSDLIQGRPETPGTQLSAFQDNDPASSYVGDGHVLTFFKEKHKAGTSTGTQLSYTYYDMTANDWLGHQPGTFQIAQSVHWSYMPDPGRSGTNLNGGPAMVTLRDPDDNRYRVVLFYQTKDDGDPAKLDMTTIGVMGFEGAGKPVLDPEMGRRQAFHRTDVEGESPPRSHKAIYNYRVLFDNGIYYFHYSDGPRVPDWPDHTVLVATLRPYDGVWTKYAPSDVDPSDADPSVVDPVGYFTRGGEYAPDNAAIWGATMLKHRGHYYLFYENYHCVDLTHRDQQYYDYDNPQTGSRVGYATAG